MKIKVIVTLKNGVLDPQGKAIQQTLDGMGFSNLNEIIVVGYVATKKIGNSIKRNKAKRLMRELARKVLRKYGKINSYYVLIAKNSIFRTSFADLEIELKKLIS